MKSLAALLASLSLIRFLPAAEITVSPGGSDAAAGSAAAPFATLERARTEVRSLRRMKAEPVTVWLEPGVFPIAQTLELGAADSGTAEAPVIWRARKDRTARLEGWRQIPAPAVQPVTEPALLARLAPEARGHIYQIDLAALGVPHRQRPPDIFDDGGGLPDLYCAGVRQPISRWPNEEKTTMARVLDRGDLAKGAGTRGGSFIYRGERAARWMEAWKSDQLWLAGFWRVPWDWETVRVKTLDPAQHSITFSTGVPLGIGSKYAGPAGAGTEQWQAFNLLEEIDQPGEWSLDFAAGRIYVWPSEPAGQTQLALALLDAPIIRLKGASHVTLRGLLVQGGLGNGVEVTDSEDCAVAGCTLQKLGRTGVVIKGGHHDAVLSCDLQILGHSGVLVGGGDRATLTPAGHLVDNCHIHHYGLTRKVYAPGIGLGAFAAGSAVGCRLTHNRIHDSPHGGVLYGGNDHVIELNEVYDYLKESDDLGGFYSTHDWTSYGNVVRHNFIHHAPKAIGVYLDDGDSGDTIEGNIAYGLIACASSGGGHDNHLRNNIAIGCKRCVFLDARGVSRHYAQDQTLVKGMASIHATQPPWSDRYPALAALAEKNPELPFGSALESNVAVKCTGVVDLHAKPAEVEMVTVRDNLEQDLAAMKFVNAAKLDFGMPADAPVFRNVPGFQPIPFEQIGLYTNELRPGLPEREPEFSVAEGL